MTKVYRDSYGLFVLMEFSLTMNLLKEARLLLQEKSQEQ